MKNQIKKSKKNQMIFWKRSHNAKKTEREDPLGFFNIILLQNQKIEGGLSWGKKSHSAEKMDALVSSGIVCYAGKLFGSVPWANRYILASSENFVELLVELFGQFRWSVLVVQVVKKNTDEKP